MSEAEPVAGEPALDTAPWSVVVDLAQNHAELACPDPDDADSVAIWAIIKLKAAFPNGVPEAAAARVVAKVIDDFLRDDDPPAHPLSDAVLNHPKLSPAVRDVLRERGLRGPAVTGRPPRSR